MKTLNFPLELQLERYERINLSSKFRSPYRVILVLALLVSVVLVGLRPRCPPHPLDLPTLLYHAAGSRPVEMSSTIFP
jgi:hypothetical protein